MPWPSLRPCKSPAFRGKRAKASPVQIRRRLAGLFVPGHQRDSRSQSAVGDGDPGVGPGGERRGDPRNDLVVDARGDAGVDLLGGAGEDRRVARL